MTQDASDATQPLEARLPELPPEVADAAKEAIEIRRDLHAHPELGFREERTAAIVTERLRALGLEVRTGVAKTGVVGLLRGAEPGRTIMVRADMDALPLQEENGVSYRSRDDGVMHACGHDGHTAMALMAARILHARRGRIHGNVKFVFQPAEEGPGGAEPMIKEGVLRDPDVDLAVGVHLWNDLRLGQVGVQSGPIMGSVDRVEITVRGKGGHGAKPQETVDPVVASAQIITALQTLISRERNPLEPAILPIGSIHGGEAFNVIPSEVKLVGTVRTLSEAVWEAMPGRIQRVAEGVAAGFGATAEVKYQRMYQTTQNDPHIAAHVEGLAQELVGPEAVIRHSATMGGEDMSFFLREIPGCFFFIGSANPEKGLKYPHHNPRFDFDEDALGIGIEMLIRSVESLLAEPEQ
ncbi:MAG: M20 family metallopeptidase [Nitrospinota bacterium]